jgi:hypothetical protein
MSTYTSLKIELIATGDQNGQWGFTTNNNLQYALEETIVGTADVAFASADITLTLVNSNLSQTARNFRLNLTGTSGGARNLIVPAIEKPYVINNGLADAVTVKNATGAGVVIPAGQSAFIYNNGTDVTSAASYFPSLSLGAALGISSGGTGQTTANAALNALLPAQGPNNGKFLTTNGSNTSWVDNPTGSVTSVSVVTANGLAGTVANPTTTPAITISTSVTGVLKGNGTAISAATSGVDYAPATSGTNILYGNGAGGFSSVPTPSPVGSFLQWTGTGYAWNTAAGMGSVTSVDVSGGSTGLTTSGGPIFTTGTITLAGTLAAGYGGTGKSTLALNNVLLGNATSAVQEVAPGTAGNVLTSVGGTWASQALVIPPSGPSVAKVYYMAQF